MGQHIKNLMPLIVFLASSLVATSTRSHAQLHWPDPPKKVPLRIRLVAVALAEPRSSFFSSREVLVAERELAQDEWSLIKLVYTFLPYQPRLTETGFNYSIVHELLAARDPNCDATVAQLTYREWPRPGTVPLRYADGANVRNLAGRRIPLPCYETSADDYMKSNGKQETEPEF